MAAPPRWGFSDLSRLGRAVLAHGLPTRAGPPTEAATHEVWSNLLHESSMHGLEGLLVSAVAADALPTTAPQRADVAKLEIDLTRRRMGHEMRSRPWLEVLDAAGIDLRLLKGPALAVLDYPDPIQRPTSDLDLLVRAEQIDRAVEALLEAGGTWLDPEPVAHYVRTVGKGATFAMPGGLEVDLHRTLVWGPFGVRVPCDELWACSRPLVFDGTERSTLGREETLLHAAAHLLVLGAVRAREVRDVGQLLCSPALDEERLLVLARHWGQEAVLATAVRMADQELELLPGSHPLSSWAVGYPVTLRDGIWLRTEQPVGRWHGLESPAVYLELRRRHARRVMREATFHPRAGTWPTPRERATALLRRVGGNG